MSPLNVASIEWWSCCCRDSQSQNSTNKSRRAPFRVGVHFSPADMQPESPVVRMLMMGRGKGATNLVWVCVCVWYEILVWLLSLWFIVNFVRFSLFGLQVATQTNKGAFQSWQLSRHSLSPSALCPLPNSLLPSFFLLWYAWNWQMSDKSCQLLLWLMKGNCRWQKITETKGN